jgi:adenosylmethionine-8-amino-7-oxononanoate aminotransferase
MRIYPGEYLRRLRRLCDEFGLLFIADEIAVGFGRTGSMFACEHAGVAPDMMTVGKGLTGGYMPMSATLVAGRIYDTFRSTDEQDRTFYHGHTYCGNPITSALALAALDVYHEEEIPACLGPRIAQLAEGMKAIGPLIAGSLVSTLGMIGAVELNTAAGGMERARQVATRARELGLFIRPMGPAIYLWPPLNITEDECGRMLDILEQSVRETG